MTQPRGRTRPWLNWLADEGHARAILVAVLVLAFALRLAAALIIPIDYRLRDDALEYVADARHLLELGVFGEEPGVPYATIPPGYPLFIAGVFALTDESLMAVRLVQVMLGTLIVGLIYLIGCEATSKRTSLLGALVGAVYPIWIIWPALFLTETLYTVLLLAFYWVLVRSIKVATAKRALCSGAIFGLALLTREVLFAFPLMLPIALWWSGVPWRQAGRYVLLFAVATLLVLSPWLARNYRTFGQAFYTERTDAIRYQLTGSGYLAPRYEYLADEEAAPPLPKSAEHYERFGSSSDMMRITNLFADPMTYLRRLVNRLVEFWLHPNGLEALPGNFFIRAVYIVLHVGMLGLAGVGIFTYLKRRDIVVGGFALLLIYATGSSLFFTNPNPRYTLPFLSLVFILAAMGVGSTWQFLRRKRATGDSKAIG